MVTMLVHLYVSCTWMRGGRRSSAGMNMPQFPAVLFYEL